MKKPQNFNLTFSEVALLKRAIRFCLANYEWPPLENIKKGEDYFMLENLLGAFEDILECWPEDDPKEVIYEH